MYAKNVAFPSGFLCNSLLKEKQKNSIVFYQILLLICLLFLFSYLFNSLMGKYFNAK